MSLFTSTNLSRFEDLLSHQLRDLYDAEQRLVDALPKMVDAAHSTELKSAFQSHARETQQHVARLEHVFQACGEEPKRETCDGIKGLLKEGEDAIGAKGDPCVIDAALIAAAQRVEHYEMAGYGTARSLAQQLGRTDIASILQQTLDEESHANETLTAIAVGTVNPRAAHAHTSV